MTVSDGSNQDAGWSNVQPLFARKAKLGESLFVIGGGNGSTALLAANLGTGKDGKLAQGDVSLQNVVNSESA